MEDRLLIGDEIEVHTSDRTWRRAVVESIGDVTYPGEPVRARYEPPLPWSTHCYLTADCLSHPLSVVRRVTSSPAPTAEEG